jgi:hypothetical protein
LRVFLAENAIGGIPVTVSPLAMSTCYGQLK